MRNLKTNLANIYPSIFQKDRKFSCAHPNIVIDGLDLIIKFPRLNLESLH